MSGMSPGMSQGNTAAHALGALPGYPDLGPDDLILSHFSLGRFRPFEERVRAAAEAGFAAMGLYVGEYERLRAQGARDGDLRAVLGQYGMRVVEIEALRGWSATGAERDAYLVTERSVFAMSDALGPGHHVQVIGPYTGTLDDAAQAFAGVCDRAAEHGLAAAIEFLPEMSNIPDAATAMQIVTRPAGPTAASAWTAGITSEGRTTTTCCGQSPPKPSSPCSSTTGHGSGSTRTTTPTARDIAGCLATATST